MSNNTLQLKTEQKNVLNLRDAYVVSHAKDTVLDLRKGKRDQEKAQNQHVATLRTKPLYIPEKNYAPYLLKLGTFFLVVGIAVTSLSTVGRTFSLFGDTEASAGNFFRADIVDFMLELEPFGDMGGGGLGVGTTTTQGINVDPNLLSGQFFYVASTTNFSGDLDFCNSINVAASLEGPELYNGPLIDFLSPTTTTIGVWNLEFSTNQDFVDAVCNFDIDFNGWQTRHGFPLYANGFSDTESSSHSLRSGGMRINKVYFEEECEEDDDDSHHYGYGGKKKKGGKCDDNEDPPDEGNKVTICHRTSSEVHPWQRIVVDEHATAGHFDEQGTPLAGHEEDILLEGDEECPLPEDPPDEDEEEGDRHNRERRERRGHGYIHIENDNNATTTNEVSSEANTGENSAAGGEGAEGGDGGDGGGDGGDGGDGGQGADGGTIETGNATGTVEVENTINENSFGKGKKEKDEGLKDIEWVELYNQTAASVSLDGWFICDAEECDELHTDEDVGPMGFALIIPDEEVLSQWEVPDDFVVILIEDGTVGDGMDNEHEALFLKRPDEETVDQVNWGDPDPLWPHFVDSLWDPGTLPAPPGGMIAREPTGFDTDLPTDFIIVNTPLVTLLYPSHIVSTPWYWEHTYIVTWEAEQCGDSGEDPDIDIILIRDTNYNGKIDDEDERIVLAEGLLNDGDEEIEIPDGFIGNVWLRLVARCAINPMTHDFDTSGEVSCSFPSFFLDIGKKKQNILDAIYDQMNGQGASEYSSLLPDPDPPEPEPEEDTSGNASSTPELILTSGTTTATTTPEEITNDAGTTTDDGTGDPPPPESEPVIKEEDTSTSTEESIIE